MFSILKIRARYWFDCCSCYTKQKEERCFQVRLADPPQLEQTYLQLRQEASIWKKTHNRLCRLCIQDQQNNFPRIDTDPSK